MATVITNLLSAIPWIGKDLVEFENLDNNFNYFITMSYLPIIGIVNSKALHKIKLRSDLERLDMLKVPRNFLSIFVGLIDGDGYIAITKTPKNYIRIDLILSLDIRDLDLINYIHSVLKVGRVNKYHKFNLVKLTISRTDLQTIVFPLLVYHNLYFLTDTRRAQFDKAMFILQNNIKKYSELPNKFSVYNKLPETAEDYCKLDFFPNWIVGFTMASNRPFKLKCSKNMLSKNLSKLVKSFNLNNTSPTRVWSLPKSQLTKGGAFRILFNTKVKIDTSAPAARSAAGVSGRGGKAAPGEGNYDKFAVSSVNDIQKVVEFFSLQGRRAAPGPLSSDKSRLGASNLHPLVGYKLTQYNNWIEEIRKNPRYKNVELPERN